MVANAPKQDIADMHHEGLLHELDSLANSTIIWNEGKNEHILCLEYPSDSLPYFENLRHLDDETLLCILKVTRKRFFELQSDQVVLKHNLSWVRRQLDDQQNYPVWSRIEFFISLIKSFFTENRAVFYSERHEEKYIQQLQDIHRIVLCEKIIEQAIIAVHKHIMDACMPTGRKVIFP